MDMADVSNIEFDRALKFSLTERGTPDLKLKTKQLEALRAVVQQKRDVLAVLPTGYGKSLIYQLLPSMFNFLVVWRKLSFDCNCCVTIECIDDGPSREN